MPLSDFISPDRLPINLNIAPSPPPGEPSPAIDRTDKLHLHDFTELIIVLTGVGIHRIGNQDMPIKAGDVFVVQGNTPHCFPQRDRLLLANIMFIPDKLPLPRQQLETIPGYRALFLLEPQLRINAGYSNYFVLNANQRQTTETLLEKMMHEQRSQEIGYEILLLSLLLDLIISICRAYEHPDTRSTTPLLRIGNILALLDETPQKTWTIDQLASKANLSKNHFMRLFKEATGMSAVDYHLHVRIRHAATLLSQSTLTIAQIANRTGFTDSNYFSRQFRRIQGYSPRQWRKNII